MTVAKTASGYESEFSPKILQKWIIFELATSSLLPHQIEDAVEAEIARAEAVPSTEIMEITRRFAIALPYRPTSMLVCSGYR